ncbi:Protein ALP1-like [Holothuria leucospilota]|uniref:Protein ALP1-like n=1 Tax=Holothuria leucospilota TaxID=206669 RepID=A0A9Q1BRA9_HOLLE|nr:Protein ALP1-like [Holothuria leucospilota]
MQVTPDPVKTHIFCAVLTYGNDMRPPNSWILGDSSYPLKRWLLTPFIYLANEAQERFNRRHRQIRSAVERCNGVLKTRWRCLMKPMMYQPPRSSRIIAACGALHNFALDHGVGLPHDIEGFVDDNLMVNANFIVDEGNGGRDNEGIRARHNIVQRLFMRQ